MTPIRIIATAAVLGLALLAIVPLLPDPWFAAVLGAGLLGVVMLRQHNAYLARKRRAWQDVGSSAVIVPGGASPQH